MAVDNIEDFQALEPFFRVIETGLAGLVDDGHFRAAGLDVTRRGPLLVVAGQPAALKKAFGVALRQYEVAAHGGKSRRQRQLMPVVAREPDRDDVAVFRREFVDQLPGVVGRAVVDEDQFEPLAA